MNNLDFLLGKEDIESIDLKQESLVYSLVISFCWEIDCGCFNYNKESKLTIYFLDNLFDRIVNDLKENKGKVYKYIINHKNYTGELLDFRVESYEGEELI